MTQREPSTKPVRHDQDRPPRRRIKSSTAFGIGTLLTTMAVAGGIATSSSKADRRPVPVEAALLDKSREQVLAEIGTGQVDPSAVTQVIVTQKEAGKAWDVAAAIEGTQVNGNDPVVGEVIHQTSNATWSNTDIPAQTKLILPIGDIKGNPPSVQQQFQHDQQAGQ